MPPARPSTLPFRHALFWEHRYWSGRIPPPASTLFAVSPQPPDRSPSTAERNALEFPALSDAGSAVARAHGLAFDLDADRQRLYADVFGHDLTRHNGDVAGSGWTLPVPATHLINRQARIELASGEIDFRERLAPVAVDHLRE